MKLHAFQTKSSLLLLRFSLPVFPWAVRYSKDAERGCLLRVKKKACARQRSTQMQPYWGNAVCYVLDEAQS